MSNFEDKPTLKGDSDTTAQQTADARLKEALRLLSSSETIKPTTLADLKAKLEAVRQTVQEMRTALAEVKARLTPEQYKEWFLQEFNVTEEDTLDFFDLGWPTKP
jgi:hypothetical protein